MGDYSTVQEKERQVEVPCLLPTKHWLLCSKEETLVYAWTAGRFALGLSVLKMLMGQCWNCWQLQQVRNGMPGNLRLLWIGTLIWVGRVAGPSSMVMQLTHFVYTRRPGETESHWMLSASGNASVAGRLTVTCPILVGWGTCNDLWAGAEGRIGSIQWEWNPGNRWDDGYKRQNCWRGFVGVVFFVFFTSTVLENMTKFQAKYDCYICHTNQ